MKLTEQWLKEQRACKEGYEWFVNQNDDDVAIVLMKLFKEGRFDWANWTIVRLMDKIQNVKYAVFAAEQVLPIFEKAYPKDERPRNAIEAAKAVAYAVEEAIDAVADAANVAYAVAYVVDEAIESVVDAAQQSMRKKILEYGLELLGVK